MKKKQQESEFRPLWGLKRKPPSNKPKEKRILETVNRMVSRILSSLGLLEGVLFLSPNRVLSLGFCWSLFI